MRDEPAPCRRCGVADLGSLTGAPVTLLGARRFLVHAGRTVREVRPYDEIVLRAQVDATRGDLAVLSTIC